MPTVCGGLRQAAAAEKALLKRLVTEAQPQVELGAHSTPTAPNAASGGGAIPFPRPAPRAMAGTSGVLVARMTLPST